MNVVLTEQQRSMFLEQVKHSSQMIEKHKNDTSKEGTKLFYHHSNILNDISTRLQIVAESQENIKVIESELSSLYKY